MSVNSPLQNVRAMTEWLQWFNKKYHRKSRKKVQPVEPNNNKGKKVDAEIEEYLFYKKRS
jgi:hypothetical protein